MSESLAAFGKRATYPVLSGTFAFLAGFCGKHAFSDDIGGLTLKHQALEVNFKI